MAVQLYSLSVLEFSSFIAFSYSLGFFISNKWKHIFAITTVKERKDLLGQYVHIPAIAVIFYCIFIYASQI